MPRPPFKENPNLSFLNMLQISNQASAVPTIAIQNSPFLSPHNLGALLEYCYATHCANFLYLNSAPLISNSQQNFIPMTQNPSNINPSELNPAQNAPNINFTTQSTNDSDIDNIPVPQVHTGHFYISSLPKAFKKTEKEGVFFAIVPNKDDYEKLKGYLYRHNYIKNNSISIKPAKNKNNQWGLLLELTNRYRGKTAKTILAEIVEDYVELEASIKAINKDSNNSNTKPPLAKLLALFKLQFQAKKILFTRWPGKIKEDLTEEFLASLKNVYPKLFQEMRKAGIKLIPIFSKMYHKWGITFSFKKSLTPDGVLKTFEQLVTPIVKKENNRNNKADTNNSPSNSNNNQSPLPPESNSINVLSAVTKTRKRKTTESDSEESVAKRKKTENPSQSNSSNNQQRSAPPALEQRQDLLSSRSSASLFKVYKAATNTNKPTNSEPNNRDSSNLGPSS